MLFFRRGLWYNIGMLIESRNNPIIKSVRALSAAKARRALGLHRIEGVKLVTDAAASGAALDTVFIEEGAAFVPPEGVRSFTVTRAVMECITDSATPQAVAATVRTPEMAPPETFPEGLIVLLDGVQDPGNAGTILRSADAFGAAGVFFSGGCADPFSPKMLRAAMGSTYHLPLWYGNAAAAVARLRAQGFSAVCGHLGGSETLPDVGDSAVLVIGSEGAGASEAVAAQCALYRLPIPGRAESLNASVAAGILLYVLSNAMRGR